MKKTAKFIGVIGGAAALIWAMRDRFVTVATSREPDAPQFRAVRQQGPKPGLSAIDGIGPVFANRLEAAGLRSVSDLADASPDRVAEAAGVSATRARSWIDQALNQV
jgi:polyhydroxyalkanoate synthase